MRIKIILSLLLICLLAACLPVAVDATASDVALPGRVGTGVDPYHNPEIGRFISADTIVGDPANPQFLNRYSYVLNNPLKYTDPSGNLVWFAPILIGMAIGASTSAAVYGGQVLLTDWDWDWRGFAVETGVGAALGGLGGIASAMKAARGAKTMIGVGDDLGKGIARPQSASLSIREARAYYNAKLPTLEKVVLRMESQGVPRETIARQTSHLRNVLKARTRGLMANRTFAQLLERYRPLKPIEHYIEKHSAEGLKGDALWNRIIEKSLTPNQGVNFFLGM
ncbi:MAG: RHS repeat-associated core domain-containing protein [Dehalococcoidia bacterium]